MTKENIFTYNEVYSSTLDYFNGDELATSVWISKYALKELDDDGKTLYYELHPKHIIPCYMNDFNIIIL